MHALEEIIQPGPALGIGPEASVLHVDERRGHRDVGQGQANVHQKLPSTYLLFEIVQKFRQLIDNKLESELGSEFEQSLLRALLGTLVVAFLVIRYLLAPEQVTYMTQVIYLMPGYLGSIYLFPFLVISDGFNARTRRLLGIFLDIGMISQAIYLAGEAGFPLFAVYLWVTIGNGFRFGLPYKM